MLSNFARLLVGSATASLLVFASSQARAQACTDVSATALSIVGAGTAVSNGAPFFTLIQKNAFGYTSTDIAILWGSSSPSSAMYYNNITAPNHFTQITDIDDVLQGDVLVIGAAGTYSGHTAIVTGVAAQLATALSPTFANTKQYALPIADSTSSVHGCSVSYPDSRWSGGCGSGTFTAGVGTGYIRIYTDLSGGLQGYSWSVTSGATYYAPATRPYAIGRLDPCPPL